MCLRAAFVVLTLMALLMTAATFPTGQANPEQASRWLEKVMAGNRNYLREPGCWRRPWVCHDQSDQFPPFAWKMCCNNRCIDVRSDANNCGVCGVRCPFSWTCCNGMCVDPKTNPFHCGACNNQCAFGSLCSHGMCGYAQPQLPPLPRFPFPFPFGKGGCKHSPPEQPPSQQHYYSHP
ncbi:hypothetical protein Taro_033378 [Colocasia esculenta]|uniref:Uncharacterized protein n=1 Tax=Colocasia esculenta TaxID=4460 RepID=A0A843VXQ2_COLES|nr:hypothetical protein [Colocasia esculenta]